MCWDKDDTFELSVFGTGFGECLLIHIGNNDWIVVDSCLNPKTKTPSVFEYFTSINIDPTKAIKLVIATHWDSDHVEGLAEIFRLAPKSQFVMSKAFKNEDFYRFVYGSVNVEGIPKKSTKEFSEIFDICKEKTKRTQSLGPIILAGENEILFRDVITINGNPIEREVMALSPSAAAQVKSLEGFSRLMADDLEPIRNLRKLENNHSSIVLWVKVGDISILLGADLEELGVSDDGWQRVVNNVKTPPNSFAEIFKIPHHGSKNGHFEGVWNNLVVKDNVSVVTSFQNGGNELPTQKDKERIKQFSQKAFLVGGSTSGSLRKDKERKNLLKKVNKDLNRRRRQLGHVVFQKKMESSSGWLVDSTGAATQL